MPLYIRDDDVKILADVLAADEGVTITEAVRGALQERLSRRRAEHEAKVEEKIRRTLEIVASMKELPDLRSGFTDKDLYDDDGSGSRPRRDDELGALSDMAADLGISSPDRCHRWRTRPAATGSGPLPATDAATVLPASFAPPGAAPPARPASRAAPRAAAPAGRRWRAPACRR